MNTKTEKPKFFGTKTDLKNSQNRKTVNPNAPLSKNSKMLGVKKVKQILVVSTLKKLTEDSMENMHTDIGPLSMSIEKGSEDLDIWKFTYLHCGGKMKLEDPRS